MAPTRQASNRARLLMLGVAAALLARGRRRIPLALLGGALIARAFTGARAPGTSPEDDAAPELVRSDVVNGIPMRWEEHGDQGAAVPVVLVHGLPTSPRAWRYVIPQLVRQGAHCLAWEQVGFGGSLEHGLGRDLSIPAQARYLHDWLNHLGVRRAVFVAHDYGGGVLQHYLLAHPETCAGLVLTDCVAYDNWPVPAVRASRSLSWLIERLPPPLVRPFFLAGLLNLGHDDPARGRHSAQLHWQPYDRPEGPRAFAHQLRHFHARDTLAVAGELPRLRGRFPARVVWGEADPLGMWSGERIARDLGAPLRSIPGGRHFTLEDHPDVIAGAITEVLAELPPARTR